MDIGGSKIAGVMFDGSRIVTEVWREHSGSRASREELLKAVLAVLEELRGAGADATRAVGIGVPGPVDANQTKVLVAPHLAALSGFELPRFIAESTGLKVVMDNDVRAAALGEAKYGTAGPSFLMVALGSGIGGAIVTDGRVWRGSHGSAGEVGQMILRENKTFEMLAAGQFVAATPFQTIRVFIDAVEAGDPKAEEVMRQMAGALGEGLANLVNVLDPAVVVLAGGLTKLWPQMESYCRPVLSQLVLSPAARELPIRLAAFGKYAGAVGAAALTA